MPDRWAAQLRAIDAQLGRVPVPTWPMRRRRQPRPARRVAPWSFAAAVAIAVVLGFGLARFTSAPRHAAETDAGPEPTMAAAAAPPRRAVWDGRLTFDAGCQLSAERALTLHVAPGCRLQLSDPALTVDVWSPSRLAPGINGVTLVEGTALFAVEPVEAGADPVEVEVGVGRIVVLGTRFEVERGVGGGRVDLLEGRIRFRSASGRAKTIEAGERLAWDGDGEVTVGGAPAPPPVVDAAPPAAAQRPGTTAPATGKPDGARKPAKRGRRLGDTRDTTPEHTLEQTLDRVARLREEGRYREAVGLVQRLRPTVSDRRTAEVLSFEEGSLRERYQSTDAVCAFWQAHRARFDRGRYAGAVTKRLSTLGCSTVSPAPER
ncbi:MAG: FecR family protein [Myxococcota bacterium]